MPVSTFAMPFEGTFRFPVPPARLWATLEQFDRYPQWWGWLRHFEVEGDGLGPGTVLRGTVVAPVPYRMRVGVHVVDAAPPHCLRADVRGDLAGTARMDVDAEEPGSRVTMAWEVEVCRPALRAAALVGRPVLRWGHDRIVAATVRTFRARVADG